MFHRNKAEEWCKFRFCTIRTSMNIIFLVTHQASVAQRFMFGLHTITGNSTNLLARRPFFVFWFMGQIHRFVLTGFSISSYSDFHLLALCLCGNVTRHSQSPWMSARRLSLPLTSTYFLRIFLLNNLISSVCLV